ncbi:MAG: hypothetical protein KME42_15510 [Tildeniella nuda ZEHNDER 1965/U140]|nr:hypothetical protein [Tildeniella nuda ZEHNDER 1965/U140]
MQNSAWLCEAVTNLYATDPRLLWQGDADRFEFSSEVGDLRLADRAELAPEVEI